MAIPLHAEVFVTTIGKAGRVVSVGRGGRYRVLVGGIEVACREGELEAKPAATGRGKQRRPQPAASSPSAAPRLPERPSEAQRARLASIDLHGATVEEALRAVETRLDEAILAGLDHLDVIHGIGTGKIRHALHRMLRGIGAVRHFEVGADNPGVTRVYF